MVVKRRHEMGLGTGNLSVQNAAGVCRLPTVGIVKLIFDTFESPGY